MRVSYVAQGDASGCGVACLAMILGISYPEADAMIPWRQNYDDKCAKPHDLRNILWSCGWFLRETKLRKEWPDDQWPPPVFAPVHHAMVVSPSGTGHWVVIDGRGELYDPFDQERKNWSLDLYPCISSVVGCWKERVQWG